MAYCGPRGIAHSVFLGGPSVWTQSDRDKALAWSDLDRQTCSGCGTRAEEWNPTLGGDYHAYEAEMVVCQGCVQIERAQSEAQENKMRGKKIRLRRKSARA